jgi:hypothetical protein
MSSIDGHDGSLFRPVRNNCTSELKRPLNANSLYRNIVRKYGQETGLNIEVNGLCVHSMRATAATNALSHEADNREGAGMAWPCERLYHHPPLRSTQDQAGGFSHVPSKILSG